MNHKLQVHTPGNDAPDHEWLMRLKSWLDPVADRVEQPSYIDHDPVQFMYRYHQTEDRNLAGFLAALFAWGRRDIVIAKTADLLGRFGTGPADFVAHLSIADERRLVGFKHRTFTSEDVTWLLRALKAILLTHGSLEQFFRACYLSANSAGRPLFSEFHEQFFAHIPQAPVRVRKHLATPDKNSSCKRLWLFLRWALRQNSCVDPGTMTFMPASELYIPLDVHVARQARRLGLLERKANDWKAAHELTGLLRIMHAEDPARYDYALFGIGILPVAIPPDLLPLSS